MNLRPLFLVPVLAATLGSFTGCDKQEAKKDTPPPGTSNSSAGPPPSATVPVAAACPDADVKDPISAPFFPRKVKGFCVDPDVKTYGEKAKLSAAEICTTAFDGGCEVYKDFGRTRLVAARYNDEAGKGTTVELYLWQFSDAHGALGMFTKNVLGEQDPTEKATPRVLQAGGAGALGTGRAYVWKGEYLIELQYNNEQESPEALTRSSDALLPEIGRAIADKLPGSNDKLAAVKLLPSENLVPNGLLYLPKNPLGLGNVGPMAVGFYKEGDKRYRVLAIAKDDVDQAKDVFKTLKSKPGSQAVPAVPGGDDAVHIATGGSKDSPKTEWLVVRKGTQLIAVGDDEFAVRAAGAKPEAARVSKDDAIARAKAILAKAPAPAGSAAPSASASAAPKK